MRSTSGPRRGLGGIFALLFVLLPALSAGAGIEGPARPGEIERLAAAVRARDALESGADLMWIGLFGGTSPAEPDLTQRLPLARLAAPLAILVLSGLTWTTLPLARGRFVAALACVALAALPPVRCDGHVLRPELAVSVFGALGLLLLVGLPQRLRAARRETPGRAWTVNLLLGLAVGTAIGLAVAAGPTYGVLLFVAPLVAGIGALRDGRAFLRVVRRFRGLVLPFRAVTLRTLPYVWPAFASFCAALLFLSGSRSIPATMGDQPLLPDSFLAGFPLLLLAVIGAARMATRVAVDIARRRRVEGRTVVAISTAVLIGHRLVRGTAVDALPAAAGLSVLCAEGGFVLVRALTARLAKG